MQGPEVVEDTIFSCLLRYHLHRQPHQLHGVQTANSFYESKQLHKILFLPSNTTDTLLPFSLSECNLKTRAATFPTAGTVFVPDSSFASPNCIRFGSRRRARFCETFYLSIHRHKPAGNCRIDNTISGKSPQNFQNETSVNLRRTALRAGVRAAWGPK